MVDTRVRTPEESRTVGLRDVDVIVPASADEAVAVFGDGSNVTVVAGGTIVVPEVNAGRLRPGRALLLARAGLDGVVREDDRVTIGAATPLAALEDGDEPLATAARHVGDPEIRAQATVGGNICARASDDAPRGDLQAPLIALGATVRSAGAGGERIEPIEDFLANRAARLVLDVSYADEPRQAGYAAAWRPHTHHYTILAVAAAKRDGELRVAATGLGPQALRLVGVEQSGNAADALAGLDPPDDALASGWYRSEILPRLVERALADLS
jgi:carbon-monoxide dehydrogenase medium subunit